ncbi:hypothetical protein [Flavobacterium panacagri]|uniref:hypothetical protein n=1 Tax=Flavobacterium panacagri TaxID=3034146 RepID=UPI0025A5D226|nr:hypothetical protein [Flavobacterium panacagri]
MNEAILSNLCVRITIIINNKEVNHGTGTLVKGKEGFFVITAHHCIYGDKNEYENVNIGEIIIEKQTAFNAPFYRIEIDRITASNPNDDWVIIKVKLQNEDELYANVMVSNSFNINNPVHFLGFQFVNREEYRSFKSRVLNEISGKEFRITLADQDNFKGGADDAKGLSGSGAFILNDGRIYLVGLLKKVKGDEAFNNDIKCCAITDIAHEIGLDLMDIKIDNSIDNWGSDQFGEIIVTDVRDLIEKIKAVNSSFSQTRIDRLCRQLALGKSELANIFERDMSAIKYRIFEECQEVLENFVEENSGAVLSNNQIEDLIGSFTNKGIEIIRVKSKRYRYPNLDDNLIRQIVLDLINECYLSFDKQGIYEN